MLYTLKFELIMLLHLERNYFPCKNVSNNFPSCKNVSLNICMFYIILSIILYIFYVLFIFMTCLDNRFNLLSFWFINFVLIEDIRCLFSLIIFE